MNRESYNEIIMAQDGTVRRRAVTEEVLDVAQSAIDNLTSDIVRKCQRVFDVPGWSHVNCALAPGGWYFTMKLPKLPLKTHFKSHAGVLYPRFSAPEEPLMPMTWVPPQDMTLAMVILMNVDGPHVYFEYQWVLALDKESRVYRLPLGNLFDDGKLCTGNMVNEFPTAHAAFTASVEQLERGQWQGDLDRKPDQARMMFRFKAKNEGFEQLPTEGTWQSLSVKIAPTVLPFVNL